VTARLSVVASFLALAIAGAQAPSRVFVVVFDEQHLTAGGLKRLQSAAVTLFTQEFQPGDRGGVVVDGQLAGNRLSSDRDELLRAVQRAHPRLATASDLESSAAIPGGAEPSARLAEIETLDAARAATDRKLAGVEALIGNLSRVDGPKAVVLMSEGYGGDGAAPRVRDLIAAAVRAGVRVHVFDESGSDRDAATGLARGTGGIVTRKASEFAPAVARIATATVLVATAAAPASVAAPPAAPASTGPAAALATAAAKASSAAAPMTTGVIVAEPSADPGVLRMRPLVESHVMALAGGDWSDDAARAGWEAYQRGDLESARAALSPIAARPVAPSWIEYVVGQADYALGQFKDASVAWERVRGRQPRFEPVYLDLADAYIKLEDRKKAMEILRGARTRWPKDAEVLNDLGVIQATAGDLDEAIKTFKDAIVIAPDDTIAYLNLGKSLEMRYFKNRRYLSGPRLWVSDENIRRDAIKSYEQYLALGGPYADQASESLTNLRTLGNKPVLPRK
jgi:tetratricopeptide (TPR) repeat protein